MGALNIAFGGVMADNFAAGKGEELEPAIETREPQTEPLRENIVDERLDMERVEMAIDVQDVLEKLSPEDRRVATKLMAGEELTAEEQTRILRLQGIFTEAGLGS